MTAPYVDLQDLNQTSGFVELFSLDTTPLGGSVYNFTNSTSSTGNIVFNGVTYSCLPITSDGWDFTSTGAPPKPTLTVSNVSKTLLAAVISLGDLVGSKVQRIRTYAKYLDAATFTRRNIVNYSEDFTQWSASTATCTSNTVMSPIGTLTGDTVTAGTGSSGGIFQYVTVTPNTSYVFSFWSKRSSGTAAAYRVFNNTGAANIVASTSYYNSINSTDWVRISVPFTTPAACVQVRVYVSSDQSLSNQGSYVWGAQCELGSDVSMYQYTTTTHQPFADPTKFVGPEAFLIEQKTGHNNEFISWQLTSVLDRLGMKLPRRQVLKDKGFPGVARTRVSG